MVIVQKKSLRKPSGARYHVAPTKRTHQKGSAPARTTIGERRVLVRRTKGGNQKNRTLRAKEVNVFDPAKKTFFKATIKSVEENTANHHFERRNIITKGAIVETEKGRVKITNRPGQEGTINGIKLT